MEEDLALFRNFLFFWGFVPLPLLPPCFSFVAKKRTIIFHLFLCLFVRYQNRKNTRITNEQRKKKRKEEKRMNEPGDHHRENQTTDRSTTNRNDVDSGPWFDPDELTPRSLWEKIGDGSFGKVYRAHLLGTAVAVKVIQNLKPDRVAGLKRDIFYLSRMTHPNVVPIYGAFIEEGMLHMVMEFVPNSLRNKRVVNQVNVVRVLQDVARALVRMHAQGHIHRDVKARNVLISAVRFSLFFFSKEHY